MNKQIYKFNISRYPYTTSYLPQDYFIFDRLIVINKIKAPVRADIWFRIGQQIEEEIKLKLS